MKFNIGRDYTFGNQLQMNKKGAGEFLEDWKLHFTIQDSGLGIKKEEIDKLFKLFGKLKIHNHVN